MEVFTMFDKLVDWVDGWEIHLRGDHGYGVYDEHGLIAGPFGTEAAAIQAAMLLPKRYATPRSKAQPQRVGRA
jgi:hypothetical protein